MTAAPDATDLPAGDIPIGRPGIWPALDQPLLQLFLHHWATRRAGLTMPRSAIDPAAIRACLPHVYLMRYDAGSDTFLCTLAGEKVNEAWGQNLIGKRPQDFMPPDSAAQAQSIYRRITLMPALHVGHREGVLNADRPYKAADRLVVPLGDGAGGPWGLFGLSFYHFNPLTEAGHSPYVGPAITYYPCAGLPAAPP
jgi:hypothetical protein